MEQLDRLQEPGSRIGQVPEKGKRLGRGCASWNRVEKREFSGSFILTVDHVKQEPEQVTIVPETTVLVNWNCKLEDVRFSEIESSVVGAQ